MTQLIELTDNTTTAAINAKGVTFVDIWAEWCPSCKAMLPHYASLAETHQDRAVFTKANIDEVGILATDHKVRGLPTVLAFNEGKEVGRLVGQQPKQKLTEWVEQMIN